LGLNLIKRSFLSARDSLVVVGEIVRIPLELMNGITADPRRRSEVL
jgi:hypothetical protein